MIGINSRFFQQSQYLLEMDKYPLTSPSFLCHSLLNLLQFQLCIAFYFQHLVVLVAHKIYAEFGRPMISMMITSSPKCSITLFFINFIV